MEHLPNARAAILVDEIKLMKARFESAADENLKDDLWIVIDRLEAELAMIKRHPAPGRPRAHSLIRLGERISVRIALLAFIASFIVGDYQVAANGAVVAYTFASKAHLVLSAASMLWVLVVVIRLIWKRKNKMIRIVRSIRSEFHRQMR